MDVGSGIGGLFHYDPGVFETFVISRCVATLETDPRARTEPPAPAFCYGDCRVTSLLAMTDSFSAGRPVRNA
jgi:hypothetical protein